MKKEIKFSFEEHNYQCLLEAKDKEIIKIEIIEAEIPKFNQQLSLKEIYEQIRAFKEYSMEEFFSALDELTKDNISLEKSSDKYYLDFAFKILKKEKHLKIEIKELSISKEDIIQNLTKKIFNNKKRIENLINEIEKLKYSEEIIKIANDWKEKGNKFTKEGKYKEAMECYTKAIENYPKDPIFFTNRSLMHYNLSEFDEALEDAEKAILIKPDNAKAYLRKGKALEEKGKNKEALDAYKLGLEKDKNNEQLIQAIKELESDKNFKISNIKNVAMIDDYQGELRSLLLLKDGRISAGHLHSKHSDHPNSRETGIDIYGTVTFNRIMFIKGLGPYQTELKNGNLLIQSSNYFSIVKLEKTSYEILQNIQAKMKIFDTIELSNSFLSNHCDNIYFYKKEGDKFYFDHEYDPNSISRIIIEGRPNELISYNYDAKTSELAFYDYEKRKVIKTINVKISNNFALKLSNNIIAFSAYNENNNEYGILLIDFIKREIIKTITINKQIPELDLHVMTLIDEKTMLIGYRNRNYDSIMLQFDVNGDNLELIDETRGINVGHESKIVKLSKGRLVTTEYYHGKLFVYS